MTSQSQLYIETSDRILLAAFLRDSLIVCGCVFSLVCGIHRLVGAEWKIMLGGFLQGFFVRVRVCGWFLGPFSIANVFIGGEWKRGL